MFTVTETAFLLAISILIFLVIAITDRKITRVSYRQGLHTYNLQDLNDEIIDGFFYKEELVRICQERLASDKHFKMERVLRTRDLVQTSSYLSSGSAIRINLILGWKRASSRTFRKKASIDTYENFYMGLPSNSSMSYFPENRTSYFKTHLPREIKLHGEWLVGLVEIHVPCSVVHFQEADAFYVCLIRRFESRWEKTL